MKVEHGHSKRGMITPTYKTWASMLQRCINPKVKAYRYYGGKGISVCERWTQFSNFLKDMGERPAEKTLDRINNSLGYSRSNCRWATRKEQRSNSGHVRLFSHLEKTKCLLDWCKEFGVKYETTIHRIDVLGMDFYQAVTAGRLRKIECKHGHKLIDENVRRDLRGSRHCKICEKERCHIVRTVKPRKVKP